MTHLTSLPTYDSDQKSSLTSGMHDVLVFKTNIDSNDELAKLAIIFSNEYRIKKWNVDLEDIDKVLRIESSELTTTDVMEIARKAGYHCEELPD